MAGNHRGTYLPPINADTRLTANLNGWNKNEWSLTNNPWGMLAANIDLSKELE
jgi:hypothetical protein